MLASIIVSLGPRYWLYVTFLTPAVILLTAEPGGVMLVDAERVGYTIIGGALAVLAALALVWSGKSQAAAQAGQQQAAGPSAAE